MWAIVAAFGDNLRRSAYALAEDADLTEPQADKLALLGGCLNYNGYGDSLEDLHFHPAKLYQAMEPYADPFVFIAKSPAFIALLRDLMMIFA